MDAGHALGHAAAVGGVCFVFPGQGAQSVGMGSDLYGAFDVFRDTIDGAAEVTGIDLARLCARGPEALLRRTENTQPAIFAVSVGIHRVLAAAGVRADVVAGHSVGEYAALTAAGALEFADACRLVLARGRAMSRACERRAGAMAAVNGVSAPRLAELCARVLGECGGGTLRIACRNSPQQVVVGGDADAVDRLADLCRA